MIIPLPGYLLIEPIEDDQKSAGGVYLPEASQDKPSKGMVVSVSPIVWIEHKDIVVLKKEGDKEDNTLVNQWGMVKKDSVVIYKKWTNQEVEDEGKKYLLVKFDELLGIVK